MTVPDTERMARYKRIKEVEADIVSHARCMARNGDPLNGGEYHLAAIVRLTAEYDELIGGLFERIRHPDAGANLPALLAQAEAEADERDQGQKRAEDFRTPGDAA